ncbi:MULTISPECIES: hypothetical protein [Pseudomonadota]|uniref:hypothetical protein n=1 Tax=Pseudomonadota TaxID=1224 RepID=UPI00260A9A4D|nr:MULTISPECIES: hypothetical protein [Pseudomonadota]
MTSRLGWECPACSMIHAPDVRRCECRSTGGESEAPYDERGDIIARLQERIAERNGSIDELREEIKRLRDATSVEHHPFPTSVIAYTRASPETPE